MAELQQVAMTRLVTEFSLILWLFKSCAPLEHLTRSFL